MGTLGRNMLVLSVRSTVKLQEVQYTGVDRYTQVNSILLLYSFLTHKDSRTMQCDTVGIIVW